MKRSVNEFRVFIAFVEAFLWSSFPQKDSSSKLGFQSKAAYKEFSIYKLLSTEASVTVDLFLFIILNVILCLWSNSILIGKYGF